MAVDNLNASAILKRTQKLVADGKASVDLPRKLGEVHEHELWKEWVSANGVKFENFSSAVTAKQPFGLGVGQYNGWISVTQLYHLLRGYSAVQLELRKLVADEIQPLAALGAIGRGRNRSSNATSNGRGADYLLARIKRDADDGKKKAIKALDDWASGKHKSVQKAAIAAGIKKVDSDAVRCPIQRIKMYWKRANAQQRQELLEWLDSAEAKLKR
jgi:hypothetical protein